MTLSEVQNKSIKAFEIERLKLCVEVLEKYTVPAGRKGKAKKLDSFEHREDARQRVEKIKLEIQELEKQ